MRLRETTTVAFVAFLLAVSPLALAAGHPGQITPQHEYTQTVDENTVTITYVVNTTGNQALSQSNVNLTSVPTTLELTSESTHQIKRLSGDEKELVSFDIRVPTGAPEGNYSVQAELRQGNNTIDTANYTVWVHYTDSSNGEDSSNKNGDNTDGESDEEESDGGVVVGISEDDCGFTCIDDDLIGLWDGFSFDWDFPFW